MELNRAKIVDENFTRRVLAHNFPIAKSETTPKDAGLDKTSFLELFSSQMISRHLDLLARKLREQQQGFYTIGSSGHEGNAAIARVFRKTDMAFLHYRSGAFIVERARKDPSIDILTDQVLSLVASSDDPISGGRHKVFGSVPLYIPPQTSTIASHLPKALGCALSLSLGKTLKLANETKLPQDSVILCSFGDASLNHSTAQGALNAASWTREAQLPLPLIWICEDNGIGISVPTPTDWVEHNVGHRLGFHYISCDGRNLCDVFKAATKAENLARKKGQMVFLHFKTVRLLGHAGSDIESQYHSLAQIEQEEDDDPLLHSARIVLENKWMDAKEIIASYEQNRARLEECATDAIKRPKLTSKEAVMASIVPPILNKPLPASSNHEIPATLNMAQAINRALADILAEYPQALVFGEDVGKKGGVYRLTADLQARFGKARVFDTLLDEQTILGTAIGLAHNGFIPIPEIQFLAYTHNAVDQIRGEAATLSFFSKGQYANPMVIRIAGLAYQKGFGGHFHNDNAIGFLREIPGLIVVCPSTPIEAALLLKEAVRLAYQEQRVVVFLEPIALYMLKDYHQQTKAIKHLAFAEVGVECHLDSHRTIISYGNGMYLARQAAKILHSQHNIGVKLIDLRWLAPLPLAALLSELQDQQEITIVDECRQTGSLSEQLVTFIVEKIKPMPVIKRVCAQDSFIPIGNAWTTILPDCQDIVDCVRSP